MDAKLYNKILVNDSKPSLKQLYATTFQNGDDPKSTSKKLTKYLTGAGWPEKLMNCPDQYPDLNPIDNIWFKLDSNLRNPEQNHLISSDSASYSLIME